MSGILISSTYSKRTNGSRNMREEKNILVQNEEHAAHMEFSGNIYNVLYKVCNEIQSKKGRYRENDGKGREMNSDNSSSSESKREIPWAKKYNEGESDNEGDNKVKKQNNEIENNMIRVLTSK